MNRRQAKFRRGRRSGFTLIEVLATLTLVGIILPVAMEGISLSLHAASNARHISEASLLAQSKLSELTFNMTSNGGMSETSGTFPDFPDYRWESQTADGDFSTVQLVIQVDWIDRGEERHYRLATLVTNGQPQSDAEDAADSASSSGTGGTP